MRFSRPTRAALWSVGHLLFVAIGVSAIGACAEIEVGAQAYKSLNRAATEPAVSSQPGLPSKPKRIVIENPDAGLRGELDPKYRSAPEVFFATGVAKWDGARTLRGIWVAHPLARQARRVRIVNRETRQAVDGALFKRDTTLAGPSLLVSSDAAQALGLSPGDPTALEIYALERADMPTESDVGETVAAETRTPEPEDAGSGGEGESVTEIAAYATERAEGQQEREPATKTPFGKTAVSASADGGAIVTAERLPAPGPSEETGSAAEADTPRAVAVAESSPAATSEAETAVRPTPAPAEPDEAALARITAAVETPRESATAVEATTPDRNVAASRPAAAQAEPVADEPLASAPQGDEGEASRRIAAANASTNTARTEPAAQPESARRSTETRTAQSDSTSATGRPAKPYIQLGVFGVPENATRLIERLRNAGLPSLTKTIPRDDGTTLIRVMAGPFDDQAAQRRAFETIKKFGINDAIAVRG